MRGEFLVHWLGKAEGRFIVFEAWSLGEGIPNFRHEVEWHGLDNDFIPVLQRAVAALEAHVRDGTKRGKEAWRFVDFQALGRGWFETAIRHGKAVPEFTQHWAQRC